MLKFSQGHTRPDILFALSQCSTYIHHRTNMHNMALKNIGRYLLTTSEKGIILKPTAQLTIDCYVDADFGRLLSQEDHNHNNCIKAELDAPAVVLFFGLPGFKMELHSVQWNQNTYVGVCSSF